MNFDVELNSDCKNNKTGKKKEPSINAIQLEGRGSKEKEKSQKAILCLITSL